MKTKSVATLFFLMICCPLGGQESDPVIRWATLAPWEFKVTNNIVYKKANGYDCKLDVITPGERSIVRPTLICIHGGGFVAGDKEEASLVGLPYLAKGMNFVNVEYRRAPISLAPAAVEDCRCALRWIYEHASEYGFDVNRLVLRGASAGGHLVLMTGLVTREAGFDNECIDDGIPDPKVAAIINLFGPTDLSALLNAQPPKWYVLRWFGSVPNQAELARQLSPVTYVHKGITPIITIHGDSDQSVPYDQAIRLEEALRRAGVPHQLYTVRGGAHGGFSQEELLKIQDAIFTFLKQSGVL
ncbi:MAG: alpha/beta hydrolase [Terriglobia bacterium]|jgi:acetyl esterase/lipase